MAEWTVELHEDFLEDLEFWTRTDRKTALRLLKLIAAVRRDPFAGLGKPERLKHFRGNVWSRRLTREHRVVYEVGKETIRFLQGRYHY